MFALNLSSSHRCSSSTWHRKTNGSESMRLSYMMYSYFLERLVVTDVYFSYGIKTTENISKKHKNATWSLNSVSIISCLFGYRSVHHLTQHHTAERLRPFACKFVQGMLILSFIKSFSQNGFENFIQKHLKTKILFVVFFPCHGSMVRPLSKAAIALPPKLLGFCLQELAWSF